MELAACRFVTYSAAPAGETLQSFPHSQALVGFLYLHCGKIELRCGEQPIIPIQEEEAFAFSLNQAWHVHAQEDAAWTLCAIECGHPEELLERWMAAGRPAEAEQLLSWINAHLSGPNEGHTWKLPIQLPRLAQDERTSMGSDVPAYLRAMRQIIDAQYQQNLTLENLASQVRKSKFHLSWAFQEHYHVTPGEYLTQVRLSHAAQMLAETDLPIYQIGQSVGISNSAYFTACFKRQYGYPPREYRLWVHASGKK